MGGRRCPLIPPSTTTHTSPHTHHHTRCQLAAPNPLTDPAGCSPTPARPRSTSRRSRAQEARGAATGVPAIAYKALCSEPLTWCTVANRKLVLIERLPSSTPSNVILSMPHSRDSYRLQREHEASNVVPRQRHERAVRREPTSAPLHPDADPRAPVTFNLVRASESVRSSSLAICMRSSCKQLARVHVDRLGGCSANVLHAQRRLATSTSNWVVRSLPFFIRLIKSANSRSYLLKDGDERVWF